MKRKIRKRGFIVEAIVRFPIAVQSFIAALRETGCRIARANEFIAASRPMRWRDIESLSIAYDFRPKGRLHRCFFICCKVLDKASSCDAALLHRLKKKMVWFTNELNVYLGFDHIEDVAEFATLVYQMIDMVETTSQSEMRETSKLISLKGKDALHNLAKYSTAREMKLRFPAGANVLNAATSPASSEVVDNLALSAKFHELDRKISKLHKSHENMRRSVQKDFTRISRMKERNPARHLQIMGVISIMAEQNGALRYNCSYAAKQFFRSYARTKDGKYKVPKGAYPTPKALYVFMNANLSEVKDMVEDIVRKPKQK